MKDDNKVLQGPKYRDKDRECIADQVQDFLARGGQIEVLGSAFDEPNDPKCRLGEEMGLFV